MFKKFKDKLAEEMKQSPARLQASMQQLAQAVVSPALSNSSIQELSTSNDNFSLTEEGDETPKNSPARHGFQNVDLMSPPLHSMGISRRSSVSSVTSDTSSLFPIYESPTNLYDLQSDMDQSASEVDDNISPQLDKITKDQLYSAYRKVQAKYQKYRGRYTDLAAYYRELERVKRKLESVLVETQDKVLRRIADLKEQCQLEQQAKAHLEEALRNDIEEKDHIINTLNTKIKLLQTSGPSFENAAPESSEQKQNSKDNLIDLSSESSNNGNNENTLSTENTQLKDKLRKLENVVLKYKDSLKRNKEKFTELMTEKNSLESDYETSKTSNAEALKRLEEELKASQVQIVNLTDQVGTLKKREEESVISLAENKLSVHRELEEKEEQIKQLQLDLKHRNECKDNLSATIERYEIEIEKFKSFQNSAKVDSEKKDIIQNISRGKSEALKLMQQEMQQKLINLEEKMGSKYHEEVDRNKELLKKLEKLEKETKPEKGAANLDDDMASLKSKLSEREVELLEAKNRLKELQKLSEEYRDDREKLHAELSNCELKYNELRSEQDAQKIVTEERKKESEISIEKLQATVQSLDKELENMRGALMDRDKVCENYNQKVHKYANMLEDLKSEINELQFVISDLQSMHESDNSEINLLHQEKNKLITSILEYKKSIKKLKEDCLYIKKNVKEEFLDQNNRISAENKNLATSLAHLQERYSKELEDFAEKHIALETELKETVRLKTTLELDFQKCNQQLLEMSRDLELQKELQAKNNKLIAEIDNLQFKLYDFDQFPQEIKVLKTESKSLKKELDNVNATNQSLLNEIFNVKANLDIANSIKIDFENLKDKYAKAVKNVESLKSKNIHFEELVQEEQFLSLEVNCLKENLAKKDTEITTLSESLKLKECTIEELQTVCKNHTKLIEEHVEKISELEKNRESLVKLHEKQIAELEESTKLLKKTIHEKNSHLESIQNTNNQQSKKIHDLTNKFDALKIFNEEESEVCRILNRDMKELELNYSKKTLELEQSEAAKMEIISENKDLKDKQNELLKQNEKLLESSEALKQKIIDYERNDQRFASEIEAYKCKLKEETSVVEYLNTLLNQQELEKQNLESQLDERDQEVRNLEAEFEIVNRNYIELRSKNVQLNSQIEDFNLCEKQSREARETFTEENEALRKTIVELNSALQGDKSMEKKAAVENLELTSRITNLSADNERLNAETEELRHTVDEKVAELKLLDIRNFDLLEEIERIKSSSLISDEKMQEAEVLRSTISNLEEEIKKLRSEGDILKQSNAALQKEVKDNFDKNANFDENLVTKTDKLTEENKKLEAQLDEALITFQAKESQMQIANDELKNQQDKLREELKTNEEEQSMRLKQLVKEFQAQLHDKDEELQAALEKRFDRQQNYETNLIQQYKEQLKDFQVELTAKSEQIESLILENKELTADKVKNIDQLTEKIALIQKEHADEIRDIEKKWKAIVQQKTDKLEAKHEEEINELAREWRNERMFDEKTDPIAEELESTSRVAMAAVHSNTGSFHTLQKTLTSYRHELIELRKLVKLRNDPLEDSTEIEYLRNILFEYMMGRETMVLARVIAAVVKFDQEQTAKILKKEEDKMTLLGSLGLS